MPVYLLRDKYNNERCVLFVAVPKTGNTAIHHRFLNDGWFSFYDKRMNPLLGKQKCPAQHFHANILKTLFDINKFHDVFMVVRNPYYRIISDYLWLTRRCDEQTRPSFDRWLNKIFNMYAQNPYIADNHIRPQIEYVLPNSRIFKYENGLSHVVHNVYSKIGIRVKSEGTIPYVNTSRENTGLKVDDIQPSDESIQAIQQFYNKDFIHFGYNYEFPALVH